VYISEWKLTYDENQAKSSPETKVGLEYIACDPSAVPHNCGNFICVCQAGGGIGMGGKGVAEMVGNNRPANGFEYDALDFVETGMSNTNSNSKLYSINGFYLTSAKALSRRVTAFLFDLKCVIFS